MTAPFYYSTTYVLDKSHFSETYDESSTKKNSRAGYIKSITLAFLGLAILLFTEINPYIAWFIVALGGVEALSIRFQKSWWLARQMISRAANNELTLTIDEDNIRSQSSNIESTILWADITQIDQTQQGWLLHHPAGKTYLSNRCLSDEAKQFISAKAESESQ